MVNVRIKIRHEVFDFAEEVPVNDPEQGYDYTSQRIFLRVVVQCNLMECRYPKKWGGRDMGWVAICIFGVGAYLVFDAIIIEWVWNGQTRGENVKPSCVAIYLRRIGFFKCRPKCKIAKTAIF